MNSDFLKAIFNFNLVFLKVSFNNNLDFLIEKENEIIPIEVISGKLRSLHILLDTIPNIDYAYVFNEDKYGELEKGF